MIPLEPCERQELKDRFIELDQNLQKGFNNFRDAILRSDFEKLIVMYQESLNGWIGR